ncbi:hypothetical protein QJS10_CPB13g00922 [Acorus calamus]|uniref:Uncharacterized protein n=1 Tax=Acorus calamus TaxID=4465 RepID=A0AAV9DHI4_ACOCL|nr:hypothetical protein QJS10_CPB13g00922 [Acorus calamus]
MINYFKKFESKNEDLELHKHVNEVKNIPQAVHQVMPTSALPDFMLLVCTVQQKCRLYINPLLSFGILGHDSQSHSKYKRLK